MSTQLLIYKTAVPVTRGRHGDCYIEGSADYGFSSEVNSVPLMAVEFPQAAGEYPIVFAGSGSEIVPAVILGVRGSENLFVSGESEWKAKYIPAFVRRYPFVFAREADRFLLCVDEEYAGFNRDGRGLRLFGEDGAPTPYVDNVLNFLKEYQAQFLRTQRFCARIGELGLLEPMQAQVKTGDGPSFSLSGFMAVNRDKLKALPAETLSELAKTDELELLYLHLQSMRNFEGLRDRLEHRLHEGDGARIEAEGALN
ncbi:SapC family protein [Rhodoblastus acidophilus]|uniref:SapC family protein n=1 Tax=Candidatus Rhodoblastus alkanivorans TaxID=2954117 RepID=A0ABS9Z5X0_9HYPH|nr:SapC family protein [Candidatus Rhodoblastus alkanivorans]MCI4677307.1 SapC family protein [Candidatus Rhodoblastus alkanivorans]MCI4682042.1 SapC family protein [Candidatus Rhodoblastus alkanivorans]MDI4639344.1 SapC family protein [Rhodoblastus acidophilus]